MKLGNQAKVLTEKQIEALADMAGRSRAPERNLVILLLSIRAGLRAKEIAGLTWRMVQTAESEIADSIALESAIAKAGSGGHIWLNKDLRKALVALHAATGGKGADPVIASERTLKAMSAGTIVCLFARWYGDLGFEGCSSHSGRRSFITRAARNISRAGGSLRDVQALARHSSLAMTQRYIDIDAQAQRKVVDM